MSQVRPAFAEDFSSIYPLFSAFQPPRPPEEVFRRLFVRRWDSPHDHFGYLLEDEGRTVGFLGAFFSRRPLADRLENFANMTCWVVDEQHRSEGLLLLGKLLALKDTTLTNFTANRVAGILRCTGFVDLAQYFKIIFPFPGVGGKALFDPDAIYNNLDARNRRIFEDHIQFGQTHVLLQNNNKNNNNSCYLVGRRIYKKRLPVFQVHYLSNREGFPGCLRAAALPLCLHTRTLGVLVSGHFLSAQRLPPSLTIPQRQAYLFRSKTVQAAEMDLLYSELQVLGL